MFLSSEESDFASAYHFMSNLIICFEHRKKIDDHLLEKPLDKLVYARLCIQSSISDLPNNWRTQLSKNEPHLLISH